MRISMMFSLWGLTTVLTACVSYHPQPLKPDASLAALDARRLDDPNLIAQLRTHYPEHSWPPARWDLDSLTLAAAEIHPDIAQAQTELKVAEIALTTAGTHPNPQLNLSGQHQTNPPDGQGSKSFGVGFDYLLETAGKKDARLRVAAQNVAVARAHLDDARWQLRVHIRDALLNLVEAQNTQTQTQAQIDIANARVNAFTKRIELGFSTRTEQLIAQAQLLTLQQSLASARQNEMNAQIQLASAIGITPAAMTNLPLNTPSTAITAKDTQSSVVQAMRERPDIQAALAEYAASEAQLQLEVAKQYPDLTLSPSYAWDASSVTWSLGVGLILPIFNHNQTGIADAEANRQLARSQFESLQLARRNAIAQAVMNEHITEQAQMQAEESAQVAQHQLKATEASFTTGMTDRVQLLDARAAQAVVNQSVLAAQITHDRAVATLEDALQLPLSTFKDTSAP